MMLSPDTLVAYLLLQSNGAEVSPEMERLMRPVSLVARNGEVDTSPFFLTFEAVRRMGQYDLTYTKRAYWAMRATQWTLTAAFGASVGTAVGGLIYDTTFTPWWAGYMYVPLLALGIVLWWIYAQFHAKMKHWDLLYSSALWQLSLQPQTAWFMDTLHFVPGSDWAEKFRASHPKWYDHIMTKMPEWNPPSPSQSNQPQPQTQE